MLLFWKNAEKRPEFDCPESVGTLLYIFESFAFIWADDLQNQKNILSYSSVHNRAGINQTIFPSVQPVLHWSGPVVQQISFKYFFENLKSDKTDNFIDVHFHAQWASNENRNELFLMGWYWIFIGTSYRLATSVILWLPWRASNIHSY